MVRIKMHEDSKSQGFCVRFCGQGMGINPLKKEIDFLSQIYCKAICRKFRENPSRRSFYVVNNSSHRPDMYLTPAWQRDWETHQAKRIMLYWN